MPEACRFRRAEARWGSDIAHPKSNRFPCRLKDASVLQAKLLKHGTLKIYPGFSHGMMTTNAGVINADILAFIKGAGVKAV